MLVQTIYDNLRDLVPFMQFIATNVRGGMLTLIQGFFSRFKIVHMVPNRAKRFIFLQSFLAPQRAP